MGGGSEINGKVKQRTIMKRNVTQAGGKIKVGLVTKGEVKNGRVIT